MRFLQEFVAQPTVEVLDEGLGCGPRRNAALADLDMVASVHSMVSRAALDRSAPPH